MDADREEKLRAAKEKLKRFQESKRLKEQEARASESPKPSAPPPELIPEPAQITSVPAPAALPESAVSGLSSYFSGGETAAASAFDLNPQPQSKLIDAFSHLQAGPAVEAVPDPQPEPAPPVAASFTISQPSSTAPPASEQQPAPTTFAEYFASQSSAFSVPEPKPVEIPAPVQLVEETPVIEPESESSEGHAEVTQTPASVAPAFTSPLPAVNMANAADTAASLSAQINGLLAANLDTQDDSKIVENSQIGQLEAKNKELEFRLEQYAASLKQYEEYAQNLNTQLLTTTQELALEKAERKDFVEGESSKYLEELNSYKESLKLVVSEKSDLETSSKQLQNSIKMKEVEITSLKQMLLDSEQRANENLEKIQAAAMDNSKDQELTQLRTELQDSKLGSDELKLEITELQSKLGVKEREATDLKAELESSKAKLEMVELNLTQLRSATSSGQPVANDTDAVKLKDEEIAGLNAKLEEATKREAELTAYIQSATVDREQIIHQYTTYCQQLTTQIEALTSEVAKKTEEGQSLSKRESELVEHVASLEEQLQVLRSNQKETEAKAQASAPSVTSEATDALELSRKETEILRNKVKELGDKLSEMVIERDAMQGSFHQKEEEILALKVALEDSTTQVSDLETKNEMLKSTSQSEVKHDDLVAACESDKVAASRAMTQNKQLKEQNEELQSALVELTNTKAELMSDLDTMSRKLSSIRAAGGAGNSEEMEALKTEVGSLKAGIDERDRTIDGLKDQMKYYVAFAENSITGRLDTDESVEDLVKAKEDKDQEIQRLEKELTGTKERIRTLDSHNAELRGQLEVLSATPSGRGEVITPSSMSESSSSTNSSAVMVSKATSASLSQSSSPVMIEDAAASTDQKAESTQAPTDNAETGKVTTTTGSGVPVLTKAVALVKLEQKFKEAMDQIADLSAENELLEHLTVQLQEETETVGEYITIYQYQRQQIKKKMEEKEDQLRLVSWEREELKDKLAQLQGLVTSFLRERGESSDLLNSLSNAVDNVTVKDSSQGDLEHAKSASSIVQDSNGNQEPTISPEGDDATTKGQGDKEGVEEVVEIAEEAAAATQLAPISTQPLASSPSSPTAQKIMALLSEIGNNQILEEDFHPWFWDPSNSAGKLETV